jgi:hypothetical protein
MRSRESIGRKALLSRPFRAVVGWVRTQGVAPAVRDWLVPGRWPEGRLLRLSGVDFLEVRITGMVSAQARENTFFPGSRLPVIQSGSRLPQSKGFARAVAVQGGAA